MRLEPKTTENPSGILPEIIQYILEYLNTADLTNLKEAGSDKLKHIVDDSITKRDKMCKNMLKYKYRKILILYLVHNI